MPTVDQLIGTLQRLAPLELAEEWDNVGLLVGDRNRSVQRVMTCLTVTPTTVAEAIERQADLIVAHHPLPFRPVSQVTTDTTVGRLLWDLIGARIAVYSPHTAFDSARDGINHRLASGLGLVEIEPLVPCETSGGEMGAGRSGRLDEPSTLLEIAQRVKALLSLKQVRVVGADDRPIRRVAIGCGSGGTFLPASREVGCDCLVTGETSFHTCLEAEATDVGLILAGHYASERFALEDIVDVLKQQWQALTIWASQQERDPLRVV